jgi:hydroxypyruvate reductase
MTDRPTILLGFRLQPGFVERLKERFEVLGPFTQADLSTLPAGAEKARALLTVGSYPCGPALLEKLPKLEIVCCLGTGFERVDLAACAARGVRVTHGADANAPDVADMAMALLLAAVRMIPAGDRFIRTGDWLKKGRGAGNFPVARGFAGMRCGILGLGAIGMHVATRARAFGMEIAYCNRRQRADVDYGYFDTVLALAEWSDALMVCLRSDLSNKHIVNMPVLQALGPRGVVVNISRGIAIDEVALADALEAKTIMAAGLDVFEEEPVVVPKLLTLDNAVLTPHFGGGTDRAVVAMQALLWRNIEAHFSGQPLASPVPGG